MFEAVDKAKPDTVIPRIRGLNMATVRIANVQVTCLLTGHKPVNTHTARTVRDLTYCKTQHRVKQSRNVGKPDFLICCQDTKNGEDGGKD